MYSFEEVQKFRQVWLWVIMLGGLAMGAGIPLLAMTAYESTDYWPALATTCIIPVVVIVLLWTSNLKTKVDGIGISYRFFPYMLNEKRIDWTDVASATVRKYSPMREYGGWGLRHTFRNGKAINVSGNMGLQLVLKSRKKILIGTQKPDELNRVLQDLVSNRIVVNVQAV